MSGVSSVCWTRVKELGVRGAWERPGAGSGGTERPDLPAGPEHPSIQSGCTGADGLTSTFVLNV